MFVFVWGMSHWIYLVYRCVSHSGQPDAQKVYKQEIESKDSCCCSPASALLFREVVSPRLHDLP